MTDFVLIVGAGPTGLTAALELTRMGIPVRLIDQAQGPATTSRAIGVQARTLELLAQRGLAQPLIDQGNQAKYGSIYGGGKRVFHLDFGLIDSPFPYLFFISQAKTEEAFRNALASQNVEPEWGTQLIAVGQKEHNAPAVAVLRNSAGHLEQLEVPWIICAEGAHSLGRTTSRIDFEGHEREEQYALGDLLITGDLPDTDFHIFSSDHGFMGLFPMGGEHFRLIASNPISAPSKDTAPSLEELQRIYDQRSHIPARFHDMTWSSWFRINSRMVSTLRTGHLLFGGDAAHIHSPAGAQGMNTGIQDMINLGWKLAMVMKGEARPELIDTYEKDRLPVIRGVLSRTDKLTTMIGTENSVVRTLFNHLGPYIGGVERVQEQATAGMSQIALNYRDGPLSEDHRHGGSLRAGDRLPDMAVSHRGNGAHLLDLLDPSSFTLLVAVAKQQEREIGDLSRISGLRIAEIAGTEQSRQAFEGAFGQTGTAALVRPDGYIAMTSDLASAPSNLQQYQKKWFNPQFQENSHA